MIRTQTELFCMATDISRKTPCLYCRYCTRSGRTLSMCFYQL